MAKKKKVSLEELLPPQNLEAEKALLGSMLLDKEARLKAIEEVKEEYFYKESHRLVFSAILSLFEKNEPVDLVTLAEKLKAQGSLEDAGGTAYLASLMDTVPSSANIEHYLKIVRDNSILRSLIENSNKITRLAYQSGDDVERTLDESERLIFDITQHREKQEAIPLRELIKRNFEKLETLYKKGEFVTGLPSNFKDLDAKTAGFQPSELIVIASRPSMGKTSLACSIAINLGIEKKIPLVFLSLEMSQEQLVPRMLGSGARVNHPPVRTGFLKESEWPKLTIAAGRLSEAPIFIDDSPSLSVLEIRAKARRLKARGGIKLAIVDYLQLMRTRSKLDNRQQEITEICASLKALAKELNIPVVALSQLSRAVESREKHRPRLSDLRESGSIEQDADLVMLLLREELYNPRTEKGKTEVIIAKQRNGPTGTINLTFLKEFTRFENYSPRHQG